MTKTQGTAFAAPDRSSYSRRTCLWFSKVTIVLVMAFAAFAASYGAAAAQSHPQPDSAAFVVSISEAIIDHKNAVTSSDCILVLPDGRFHLERRKEIAPNPTSSLNVFESSLDSVQLEKLQDILKDESIKKLPDYTLPAFPMAVPWFATVKAKIARDGLIRTVGYWLWRGGAADESPNSTPDNAKKVWRNSEIALQPLVEWFHGIEALKLTPSAAEPSQCNAGGSSDGQ